ncbi:AAA-like domain-containing protein [Aphanizomenon flos-aquae NRERC-008]|uniref:AAA-like domain-containing protein n=2 Tax=Aphanizomenon flos-aquae TaxID=1176 RepID=A0ABR8IWI5_APHFL|nr:MULTISPECIES: AAA-like domain-containing protein [Aphanizomenon]MBD2392281.1 AAA-like domain-containing protein [Aphanizomenon flos-aquae FACHB-1171]MBD2558334.1 AAA-like domain-containing protein [Aphanizomenon flos-aquae FACHB-1290]MBD2630337.1 AAA-like domain-containing protein [Aphanizomenon sp. FACHB-1399]MBD2644172.1 AAA-like domain-containing protein [Aphanizomenon sp. FACHB-1401]MBD2659006.1 AAA-like domain-containing protein [Aphanizomenon flos-aquae FACHB-1265]
MKRILILTANPTNTKPLRVSEEVREIKRAWERSQNREKFEIIVEEAVRPQEFRRTLLGHKPNIVHFSGHGGGEQGLALMGDNGEAFLVKVAPLAKFFKALQEIFFIDCVFLNACYSDVQAEGIYPYVNYVVGMNQKIGDEAAKQFAIGFYDTLFAGQSIQSAFDLGCNAIEIENIPEHLTPVLRTKDSTTKKAMIQGVPESKSEPIQPRDINIPFENLDGQVPLNSPFYVERPPIEATCYNAILKPGILIRIKAPRQMGKTSLMSRILYQGEKQGYQTGFINLWSRELFKNLDSFLESFCANVSLELGIEEKIDQYWKPQRYSSQTNCTNYFQSYLLKELKQPVILGLDEVDRIFQYSEIADEFFTMLRSWHEKGKNNKIWQKLRLVISHSQEVYISLDVNKSPFNVGLPIDLNKFSLAQLQNLVKRHGLQWSDTEINQLMGMIDGHPYLVRTALYHIATNDLTLKQFLEIAPTEEGLYEDHLYRHLLILEENKQLKSAMLKLVNSDEAVTLEPTYAFKLKSMGLAESKGNKVIPLCNLYRIYFSDRLQD